MDGVGLNLNRDGDKLVSLRDHHLNRVLVNRVLAPGGDIVYLCAAREKCPKKGRPNVAYYLRPVDFVGDC